MATSLLVLVLFTTGGQIEIPVDYASGNECKAAAKWLNDNNRNTKTFYYCRNSPGNQNG